MNSIERGSQTAKNGFKNEDDIVAKFNNWEKDIEAKIKEINDELDKMGEEKSAEIMKI